MCPAESSPAGVFIAHSETADDNLQKQAAFWDYLWFIQLSF